MNGPLHIVGGGPAGATAAIAARQQGREVVLFEKSPFPRHKVCGEFLSPGVARVLDELGLGAQLSECQPAVVRRVVLHFGARQLSSALPEPALGLSRYALDELLRHSAVAAGAEWRRECVSAVPPGSVLAAGRDQGGAARRTGQRLFGFKAHYSGPATDAVELYFFRGCYLGINAIEGGLTNVCGLGPEAVLQEYGFEIDSLLQNEPNLRSRLTPLTRVMKWHTCGPLVYRQHWSPADGCYPAGDRLSFVDPFTGSGLLTAILTGKLAGTAAANGQPVSRYLADCRRALRSPFRYASLLRFVVNQGWAAPLSSLIPSRVLFALTRPHV